MFVRALVSVCFCVVVRSFFLVRTFFFPLTRSWLLIFQNGESWQLHARYFISFCFPPPPFLLCR